MAIEKALKIGFRGFETGGKAAIDLLKSGWGKAAVAMTGTGLVFSNFIYPQYQGERTAAQAKDVKAESQRSAIEAQNMLTREYVLERERQVSGGMFETGKTPSGQYNLSGVIILIALVVIAFVVLKVVKK